MGRYLITPRAQEDIDEILTHIAADNLDAALSFNDRLTHLFEMLADNTLAGRARPELKEDLRSFPEGNYVIFYRPWAGKVAVVRVIHSARDLDEMFS
jgi:Plasmid stabilization system protein